MRSRNGKPTAAVCAGMKRPYSMFLAISLIAACSGAPPQTATAQGDTSLGQLDRSLRTLSENVNEAVVQVVSDTTGEIVYALRLPAPTFQPWTFDTGPHSVRIGEPDTGHWRELTQLRPVVDRDAAGILRVSLSNEDPRRRP